MHSLGIQLWELRQQVLNLASTAIESSTKPSDSNNPAINPEGGYFTFLPYVHLAGQRGGVALLCYC